MPPRLRVQRSQRHRRHVLRFEGEVDGSTACRALAVLAQAPPGTRELVLDLSGLTGVEAFGLEVLVRGLRQLARERRVRIQASPRFLPVLTYMADSLIAEHAT